MKKVYMVMFDWSTTDDGAIEVELFNNYEKAVKRFNEIIENELNPDMSWVGSEAFDSNRNIQCGFTLESYLDSSNKDNLYWNVTDNENYYRHSFIDLQEMEVK